MNPPPLKQYNQWACSLACYVWCMNRHGASNLTQEDYVRTNKKYFWEWSDTNPKKREGLVSRGQLFDMMDAASQMLPSIPSLRKHIHTNSVTDFHDYLNRNYSGGYIGGFVMTRQTTNHCLAIVQWDGQNVEVMNPSGEGHFQTVPWTDFEMNSDADFLAFFK